MAVPQYNKMMLPLLQFMSDGQEHHVKEAIEPIADYFDLTQEDRNILRNNSKQTQLYDRIHWANTYMKKAFLLESTRRGYIRITERGLAVLNENPSYLDKNYLMQFPEFLEFVTPNKSNDANEDNIDTDNAEFTPKELIDATYRSILNDLADQLLETVLSASPAFFEQLVVDLLLAMGYGSALQDAGQAIGQTNDGGIDGYIQEDKLGLDTIYIQAKRWAIGNTVGRPDIQGFVGSLMGEGATKGVFITTSDFSKHAVEYADSIQNVRVILIDGQQLAQLMIEHNVGVSVEKTYTIKQIDENYFPD
jgi:restriction system protein